VAWRGRQTDIDALRLLDTVRGAGARIAARRVGEPTAGARARVTHREEH
jgi:hypothetical protein